MTSTSTPPTSAAPYAGMRPAGRIALVVAAHVVLAPAFWWAWHPREADMKSTQGSGGWFFVALSVLMLWAVLLQASAALPFPVVCGAFLVLPAAPVLFAPALGLAWQGTVMNVHHDVTVTAVQRLFNGESRVHVRTQDGRDLLAYSTLGHRTHNYLDLDDIPVGGRYDVLTDPTGVVAPVLKQPGFDQDELMRSSRLPFGGAIAAWTVAEAVCLSALTRRRSQLSLVPPSKTHDGS